MRSAELCSYLCGLSNTIIVSNLQPGRRTRRTPAIKDTANGLIECGIFRTGISPCQLSILGTPSHFRLSSQLRTAEPILVSYIDQDILKQIIAR